MDSVFVHIDCPVCGGVRFKNIWQATPRQFLSDFRKSYYNLDVLGIDMDTLFFIKECKNCSFVFVNPRLRSDLYDVVYNEAKVEQNRKKDWLNQNGDMKCLYDTHSKWTNVRFLMKALSYRHRQFAKSRNEKQKRIRLLDYGCGYGHTLDLCRVFGVESVGVELDSYRIQFCREKGLDARKPNELDTTNKFDIVISTSVIEHIDNLDGYFRYITDRLNPGGRVHLTGITPAVIRKEQKKQVYRLVMPLEHLNFFTAKSFDVLSTKYGLKRISSSNMFQVMTRPVDYFTPFLKNFVFRGFYPTGNFEADLIK